MKICGYKICGVRVYHIVDGHHRFFACKKLGFSEVPTMEVTLPYNGYFNTWDLITNDIYLPVWWKDLQVPK